MYANSAATTLILISAVNASAPYRYDNLIDDHGKRQYENRQAQFGSGCCGGQRCRGRRPPSGRSRAKGHGRSVTVAACSRRCCSIAFGPREWTVGADFVKEGDGLFAGRSGHKCARDRTSYCQSQAPARRSGQYAAEMLVDTGVLTFNAGMDAKNFTQY